MVLRSKRTTVFLWAVALALFFGQTSGQVSILNPEENSVTALNRLDVTIKGEPGADAALYVGGSRVESGVIHMDGEYQFLNIEVPGGTVELKVETLGPGGRAYSAVRTIQIVGPPSKFVPYEANIELPADGRTEKVVRIEIQDNWGQRLKNIKVATVGVSHGWIMQTDVDPINPGIQLPVRNGVLDLRLRGPEYAARAVLEVEVDGTFGQIPVRFTVPPEPLILVGSLNASVGNYQTSNEGNPIAGDREDNTVYLPEKNLFYGGRNAFYAKGKVWEKYRLTASFDSDRYYRDQLFEDIDPDYQYPIYGDASILSWDAQTESRFFAKVEHNESFVLVGDYNTYMNSTEFTAYDRSFTGLLSNFLINRNHSLTGFATLTDREMTLDEIRGEGLSGYYRLTEGDITGFSEKVRIEVRDRYHPETVIKSTNKVRYQDYDIDYVDGTLMFKQPVPSVDGSNNPVFIVISYEHKSQKSETVIGGLRYAGTFADRFRLGSTFILEEQSPENYMLYGIDAMLPITRWIVLKGEVAQSRDLAISGGKENGAAYKTELSLTPWKNLALTAYYRKVDTSFVNHSQTARQFELGSQKYGFAGTFRTARFGSITSQFYRQFNRTGTPYKHRIQSLTVMYETDFSQKGSARFGYEGAQSERWVAKTGSFALKTSQMMRSQLAYQFSPRLSGTLESDINVGQGNQSKPNSTSAGVIFALTDRVNTFLKYRLISGGKRSMQTILGFDSKVTENTEVTGKYEIGGAIGEDRNRASIGLRNNWKVSEDLTLNFAYESVATTDSLEVRTREHESVSIAVEFLPELPLKTMAKYEFGRDRGSRKHVGVLGLDVKIYDGLSTIAKAEYFDNGFSKQGEGRIIRGDYQLGLALRPELSDYFNMIGKIQYVTDNNSHIDPAVRYDRFIASILAYLQPLNWLEIGGRYARRWVMDREEKLFTDESVADFYLVRFEVDWALKWSTAVDLRYLVRTPVKETKTGIALEVNYLLFKNIQMGLGYAFKGYEDADFSILNYQHHNYYLTTHIKFSEDIFNWR